MISDTNQQSADDSLFTEFLEDSDYDYQHPKRGDIRNGIIVRKDEHQLIVDIGVKREGIVPASDLEKLGPEAVAELSVGDEVPVYVLHPENRDGDVIVSINMARQMADWDHAEQLMETNAIIETKVTGYNKGGLLASVGHLQGFIPRSHIVDLEGRTNTGTPLERLSQMVGQELPLKVIEVNRRQRRLILSERAAWREWRAEQKKRLLADLEVGDIRSGTVTSIADFGAFVDLGGADGLIHVSEISWDRGKKPSDVVQVGDEVQVKIIHVDRERKRIGLSLKQLRENPWDTLNERYAIDQYVEAEITNLAKFGAFARIEEGIEGLIHISELSEETISHPSQVVRPGQRLTVQIIGLDAERKRVALSLRRVPDHLQSLADTTEEPADTEAPPAEPMEPEPDHALRDDSSIPEIEDIPLEIERVGEVAESEPVEGGTAGTAQFVETPGVPANTIGEAVDQVANTRESADAITGPGAERQEAQGADTALDQALNGQSEDNPPTTTGVNGDKAVEQEQDKTEVIAVDSGVEVPVED